MQTVFSTKQVAISKNKGAFTFLRQKFFFNNNISRYILVIIFIWNTKNLILHTVFSCLCTFLWTVCSYIDSRCSKTFLKLITHFFHGNEELLNVLIECLAFDGKYIFTK